MRVIEIFRIVERFGDMPDIAMTPFRFDRKIVKEELDDWRLVFSKQNRDPYRLVIQRATIELSEYHALKLGLVASNTEKGERHV